MKNNRLCSFLLAGLCSAFVSCTKEEVTINKKPSKLASTQAATTSLVYMQQFPVLIGEQATGSMPALLVYGDEDVYDPTKYPFERIPEATSAYKKGTCLFDISHLEAGKAYRQVDNKNLNIAFFDPSRIDLYLTKLKATTPPDIGWTAAWGTVPSVESTNPDVLYINSDDEFYILLSKPVTEFGFELAPNSQDKEFRYRVYYGNTQFDDTREYIQDGVKTPSGARLFAVKSTKPFNTVTIFYSKTTGTDVGSQGAAIANIRYKLAK
jgi:hypothetical protein